jgi:hypothetical protein
MSPDDIKHALSDVHVPEIKLGDIDPRKVELPASLSKMDLPRIDLSKIDVSKVDLSKVAVPAAVASLAMNAAERAHLRRKRRSRRPYLIAGLVLAALAFVVARNMEWIRARAAEVGERIRQSRDAGTVDGALEPIGSGNGAYTDDVAAIPIEPEAYAGSLPSDEPAFPTASEELETEIADRVPAVGESVSPSMDPERPTQS